MTETLKPCPFCGGAAKMWGKSGITGAAVKTRWWRGYVHCVSCNATICKQPSKEAATQVWNRRASPVTPA